METSPTVVENAIVAIFQGLHRQGNTIIMVTHNQELADLTERIFYLKDGEIVREEKRGG